MSYSLTNTLIITQHSIIIFLHPVDIKELRRLKNKDIQILINKFDINFKPIIYFDYTNKQNIYSYNLLADNKINFVWQRPMEKIFTLDSDF